MRLTDRDKKGLILLSIIAIGALYYFFLLTPTEEKLKERQMALVEKAGEQLMVEFKLATEPALDESIESLEQNIKAISGKYYSEMTQEEVVMLVAKSAQGVDFAMPSISLSDSSLPESNMIQYTAEVQFESNYSDLMSVLRTYRQNDHYIAIRELSVQHKEENAISGRYKIEINAFPQVAVYAPPAKKQVVTQPNFRDISKGPFEPYALYIELKTSVEEAALEFMPEPEVVIIPPPLPAETPEIDYENYRPRTLVHDFEEGNYFFVGNLPEIEGHVTRNRTKMSGGFSAEIAFDFKTPRPYSEANLVFEYDPVLIHRQVEFLGLWIYAYEASNHGIGLAIVDAVGREYKVPLTQTVDWTQWKEVEVLMPVGVSYPVAIQRIYVEGIGYDQKLTGKYLFDQLQVSYPID